MLEIMVSPKGTVSCSFNFIHTLKKNLHFYGVEIFPPQRLNFSQHRPEFSAGNTGSAGLSTLIPLVGLCVKPMVGNGFPAAQTILSRWLQSETYWMWFKGEPMRQHVCMYV